MPHPSHCVRTRLADGPIGHIDHCSCGVVYVTSGALSLRLPLKALDQLGALLDQARQGLADLQAPAPRLRLVDAHGGDA